MNRHGRSLEGILQKICTASWEHARSMNVDGGKYVDRLSMLLRGTQKDLSLRYVAAKTEGQSSLRVRGPLVLDKSVLLLSLILK